MSGVVAVLPVKRLGGALRRLATALPAQIRRELQVAMLRDVLGAIAMARRLEGAVVVTSDPEAAALAHDLAGATVIADHDPPRGINGAVRRGIAAAGERRASGVLVMTADLPLITAEDIDAVVAAAPAASPSVVMVPSWDGTGTNALLIRPPGALRPMLGPDSRARHLAAAHRGGVTVRRLERPRIALDIDTPRDLEALIGSVHECATRAACDRLAVRGLLAAGSPS